MKYKVGDELTAFRKTSMNSFKGILTSMGEKTGLNNILPVTGEISRIVDDHYEFELKNKFWKYFCYKYISMNESDFVNNDEVIKQISNEYFII